MILLLGIDFPDSLMACAVFDAVDGFHRGEHGVVHIVIPVLTVSADAEQIFKAAEIILHLVGCRTVF